MAGATDGGTGTPSGIKATWSTMMVVLMVELEVTVVAVVAVVVVPDGVGGGAPGAGLQVLRTW